MIFEKELSFSIIIIYIVPIIRYLLTHKLSELKALVGLGGTILFTKFIKHFVVKNNSPRPIGAKNCNLFANNGDQAGKPGMPSGHSSRVSFFVGYYLQQTKNIWIRSILILYAFLVMISRYTTHCHTLSQILAGSSIGILFSLLTVNYL